MSTTDYSTLSKDELADKLGAAFGEAQPFIVRGEPIPVPVWTELNHTVSGLCERVGIATPAQMSGHTS